MNLALTTLCIVLALIVCAGLLVRRSKKYSYADLVEFGQECTKVERNHVRHLQQQQLQQQLQQQQLERFARIEPASPSAEPSPAERFHFDHKRAELALSTIEAPRVSGELRTSAEVTLQKFLRGEPCA